MKRIIALCILWHTSTLIFSQIPNNESIEYKFAWTTFETTNGLTVPKFEIRLKDTTLYSTNIDSLILYLKSPDHDWSANLILYAIFKKDAAKLKAFDDIPWQEIFKEEDVMYWNSIKQDNK